MELSSTEQQLVSLLLSPLRERKPSARARMVLKASSSSWHRRRLRKVFCLRVLRLLVGATRFLIRRSDVQPCG
jgi:hypothetical protein